MTYPRSHSRSQLSLTPYSRLLPDLCTLGARGAKARAPGHVHGPYALPTSSMSAARWTPKLSPGAEIDLKLLSMEGNPWAEESFSLSRGKGRN